MKKTIIICGIVLLLIAIFILIYIFVFPFFDVNNYYSDNIAFEQIEFTINNETSQDKNIYSLVTQYFDYYKNHGVYSRLIDYNIKDIKILNESDGVLRAKVNYDVKPLYGKNTNWSFGNGTELDNGWINNKSGIFKFIIEGDTAYLKEIVTG